MVCSNFEQNDSTQDESLVTLESAQEIWESHSTRGGPQFVQMIMGVADFLSPSERRRFLYGKRGEIRKLLYECDSRSGAYELTRSGELFSVLESLGLIQAEGANWRDVQTRRRVKTIIRELGRLGWDWDNEHGRDWLVKNWAEIVTDTLDDIKEWVRDCNQDG